MAPRSNIPQAIVSLLSREANATDGLTATQIAQQLGIAYPTVAKWVKKTTGIAESLRPVYPTGYYFDSGLAVEQHENGDKIIRPETFFGPLPEVEFFPKTERFSRADEIATFNGIDKLCAGLKEAFMAFDAARINAANFATGKGDLDVEVQRHAHNKMVAMRRALEGYCKIFAAYQDDPVYQTPEYWRVWLKQNE